MNRARSSMPGACPDAAELSTFFEGRLADARRTDMVAHVADCGECRAALGALERLTASEPPVVSSALLDAAAGRPARARWGRVAAVMAAAACVLFAVSISRNSSEQPVPAVSTPGAIPSEPPDDVRAKTPGTAPQLMAPKAGASLGTPTRFEWTPVAGAVQYQLHVLTGDGEVVFDATTTETGIEFLGVGERPGPFYAWISAQLTDGRRVQSAVVRLTGPAR
jgi:hypothetical protein